jgi:hypothetical protein
MASPEVAANGMDSNWQAKSDVRTLALAEEIKGDPKRYKAALAEAKRQIANLQDVQDDASEDAGEEAKDKP